MKNTLFLLAASALPVAASAQERPNIILINLDDVGYGAFAPGNDGAPGKLANRELTAPELYDLRRDPGERYNVMTLPAKQVQHDVRQG